MDATAVTGYGSTESGFAAGVRVNGLVFAQATAIEGQSGQRVEGAESVAGEIDVCLSRLAATLEHAGCAPQDILKMNCYLADDTDRSRLEAAVERFVSPGPPPAQLVQTGGVFGQVRVMLDVVAGTDQ